MKRSAEERFWGKVSKGDGQVRKPKDTRSYFELLKDPRWQKRRLEVFERDDWECCNCGSKEETLNVHHRRYTGKPWEAPLSDLTTLCEKCHRRTTDLVRKVKDIVGAMDESDLWTVLGYAEGLVAYRGDNRIEFRNHGHIVGVAQSWGVPTEILVTEVVQGTKQVGFDELHALYQKHGAKR